MMFSLGGPAPGPSFGPTLGIGFDGTVSVDVDQGMPVRPTAIAFPVTVDLFKFAASIEIVGNRDNMAAIDKLDPNKLTEAQQKDHDTIIRLRNAALDHVETGAKIAGDYWHRRAHLTFMAALASADRLFPAVYGLPPAPADRLAG